MHMMNRPELSFPKPGQEHVGIYIPAHAPPGTFFIGRGIIVEAGINPQGGPYIWVEPAPRDSQYPSASSPDFRDPAGNPMPAMYLPRDPDAVPSTEIDLDTMRNGSDADGQLTLEELLRKNVKPGDEALGVFQSFDGRGHIGVGRVLTGTGDTGQAVRVGDVYEKLSANPVSISGLDPPNDIPGGPQRPDHGRFLDWHLRDDADQFPEIGSEAWGAYLAPDGRWYVGYGLVIALGRRRNASRGYVLAVPLQGTPWLGGDDCRFFHPVTGEYMPAFEPPVTASMRWPWRGYFTQELHRIAPASRHVPWLPFFWPLPAPWASPMLSPPPPVGPAWGGLPSRLGPLGPGNYPPPFIPPKEWMNSYHQPDNVTSSVSKEEDQHVDSSGEYSDASDEDSTDESDKDFFALSDEEDLYSGDEESFRAGHRYDGD
ncbi:hypothetical protein BJY00DRAFT_308486 [Aspergillus carlsbadensis]|nr:hypothetical protein BJY00DRAFT_308486 [Aspergillus carlsbadensis]